MHHECAATLEKDLAFHGALLDPSCVSGVVEARGGLGWALPLRDEVRRMWTASQSDRYYSAGEQLGPSLSAIYSADAQLDALVHDVHDSCSEGGEPLLFMTVSRHSHEMLENWIRHVGDTFASDPTQQCAFAVVFLCETDSDTAEDLARTLDLASGAHLPVRVLDGPSVLKTHEWPLCEHVPHVDASLYGDVASGVKIKAALEILRRAASREYRHGSVPLRLIYSDTDVVWLRSGPLSSMPWDADLHVSSYHFALDTGMYAGAVALGDVCLGQWMASPSLASVAFFSHLFGRMTTFAGSAGVASCDDQAVFGHLLAHHSARIVHRVSYGNSTLVWGPPGPLMLHLRVLPADLYPTLPNYAFGIGLGLEEDPVSVHATNWHDIDAKAVALAERGLWRVADKTFGPEPLSCSALEEDTGRSYMQQEAALAACLALARATDRALAAPQLASAILPSLPYLSFLGATRPLTHARVPADLFYAPSCLRGRGFDLVPRAQSHHHSQTYEAQTRDAQIRAERVLPDAARALRACRSKHNLIPY